MKEERKMLRSPKIEEQQLVPDFYQNNSGSLEDIKGFLGINNDFDAKLLEEEEDAQSCKLEGHFFGEHEFFGWDFFSEENIFPTNNEETRDESFISVNNDTKYNGDEKEFGGFWDDNNVMEERKASLKLNLNYEEVLEAWSNRGSLWAQNQNQQHHHEHASLFISSNNNYMGEVPNLEDERTRRETSVLRYKEKRHNRLFAKKIRYEVRKVNADKRPRLKGRFVKRVPNNNTP